MGATAPNPSAPRQPVSSPKNVFDIVHLISLTAGPVYNLLRSVSRKPASIPAKVQGTGWGANIRCGHRTRRTSSHPLAGIR